MNRGTIVRNDIIYSGEKDKVSYVPTLSEGTEIGTLTINGEDSVLYAPAGGGGGTYTLPAATSTTLGGIKVGENLTINEDGVLNAEKGGSTVTASADYTDGTKIATITIDGTNTNIKVPALTDKTAMHYKGKLGTEAITNLPRPSENTEGDIYLTVTEKDYDTNAKMQSTYGVVGQELNKKTVIDTNGYFYCMVTESKYLGDYYPILVRSTSSSYQYDIYFICTKNYSSHTYNYIIHSYWFENRISNRGCNVNDSITINGKSYKYGYSSYVNLAPDQAVFEAGYPYKIFDTWEEAKVQFAADMMLEQKIHLKKDDIAICKDGNWSKLVSAGIGNVSVTQAITEGTEIGSITIDGTETKLYTSSDCETSEVKLSTEGYTDNSIRFGITDDGQYGYYKVGADTVTPFKNGAPSGSVLSFGMTRCGSETKDVTLGQSYNSDYIQIIDDVKLKFLKSCSITIRILTSGNASYTSGYTIYLNNEIYKTVQHSVWTYDESYSLNVEEGDVINMTAYAHSSWQRDYSCCISLSN